jgi:ectoine hydroxylase-related dioxygenase (phytanoyl-CoA dioxygenase family)
MTHGSNFGVEEAEMQRYFVAGEAKARHLGNRGPLCLTPDGKLHPQILEAYQAHGFYIFEGLLRPGELTELRRDYTDMADRLPVRRESSLDKLGRPALGVDLPRSPLMWAKPLGDPLGGTTPSSGRYPVKMIEGQSTLEVPQEIVYLIMGTMQFSDAALRLYAHPGLLAVSAAVNGEDFVPFSEATIIKTPREGSSFAWHQDGLTHWDSPAWDAYIHGFNFMAQLYGSTAANGVWVIPGSHKQRKLDIAAIVRSAGSDRLTDAVPLICAPGDIVINNRQVLHGSFPNTSDDLRVTINFGFHRRSAVLGAKPQVSVPMGPYDEQRIRKRSELIGYAIDARHQRFPDEVPYTYRPHVDNQEHYRWNAQSREKIRGYNTLDLII